MGLAGAMSGRRSGRLFLLIAGLVLPQFFLFGPSLLGTTYLLPLDVLAGEGHYLVPRKPDAVVLHSNCFADIVTHNEMDRMFAAAELRAGRLPTWNPYIYGGTPFAVWPKFAPHSLLYCLFPTPVTLAWLQLCKSVLAGIGAYLFFRAVLEVAFWPALIGAWCLPVTAYFILWQGCLMSYTVAGLPWLLLAVEWTIRRPGGRGGPLLALVTGLLVISSSVDTAALALLASGVYGLWRIVAVHGWKDGRALGKAAVVLGLGWGCGILLSLPHLLPLADYVRTSAQVARRFEGQEPRPPLELHVALTQMVLPRTYGPLQRGGYVQMFPGNFLESNAASYVGLLATLWLAPLAFLGRGRRAMNGLWLLWIILGLGWQLNIPGVIDIMRLPYLNVFPHSRFVFAAAFAMVALAVTGLDVLAQQPAWRSWCWGFVAVMALLFLWCLWGCFTWPELLGAETEAKLQSGMTNSLVPDLETLRSSREEYAEYRLYSAFLCLVGVLAWLAVYARMAVTASTYMVVAVLWLGELLCFANGRNPQCDPALYYPSRPLFEALRAAPPGRIMGVMCFPANYGVAQGLRDIRGYDGVDPERLVRVLDLVRKGPENRPTQVQWFIPDVAKRPSGEVRVAPLLSMCGVRYFLVYGDPAPGWPVMIHSDGFWVYENKDAVPRVYVPAEVKALTSDATVLAAIARPDFEPQRTAYVEAVSAQQGHGKAEVSAEVASEVTIAVDMEAPGVVVLADRWDPDWHAYVDGQEVPLLRTNYVFRGVQIPAGRTTLVFRYHSSSLVHGTWGMALGLAVLAAWSALALRTQRGSS